MGLSSSKPDASKEIELPWSSVPPLDLKRMPNRPFLVYVYSPLCPYCVRGQPIFEQATRGLSHVYRYNAIVSLDMAQQRHQDFEAAFGIPIAHYPMVLGLSKQGRIVEYTGAVDSSSMQNFLEALART